MDLIFLLQEKTRAAAAPRNPKKGAVSSPLKLAMFGDLDLNFGEISNVDGEKLFLFCYFRLVSPTPTHLRFLDFIIIVFIEQTRDPVFPRANY